jgi:hypothetical protein
MNWEITNRIKLNFSNNDPYLNLEKALLGMFPPETNAERGEEDIFIFITTHLCLEQT